ncbi:hypothetical protein CDL15_Pgr004964 [Punica granatum]|nr:hypothetical protein CDL15_Pgr004964 [Punica granatum]
MTHTSTTPYMSFTMGKVLVVLMVMVVSLMRHPHRPSPDLPDVCTAMFSERKRKDLNRTIDYERGEPVLTNALFIIDD